MSCCAPQTLFQYELEPKQIRQASQTNVQRTSGRVYACVFTGRWIFLRVLLPYHYRLLFAPLGYISETQLKLQHFSTATNSNLQYEVFQFLYLKKDPTEARDQLKLAQFYTEFYYVVLQRLLRNPADVCFEMDDDIVYLHSNVFGSMLKNKNRSDYFIHVGNIVTNWRLVTIGAFDKAVNSKGLKIEYSRFGECGWQRPKCREMVCLLLRAFVHHYHKKQLSKYLILGRSLTAKGHRFSINFFLLDVDIVDIKQMMEFGAISDD